MGIFSMRRVDDASALLARKQPFVFKATAQQSEVFAGRSVEFVAAVPAPPAPRPSAPPAPRTPQAFVPDRFPFLRASSGEDRATGHLHLGPDSYQGSFARGVPECGTWRFADGGEFQQEASMRHLALDRGSHYFGEVQDGLAHGAGMVRWGSGDSYTGAFADGLPCGPGLWRFPDGNAIALPASIEVERFEEGEWAKSVVYCTTLNDAWHGRGIMQSYSKGAYESTYVGDFTQGWSSGHGAIYYENGSIYRGEVKEGLREGRGVFQGTWGSLDGTWREDEFNGHGTSVMISDDNRIVTTVGEFEKDQCVWGRSECEGAPTWIGPFKVVGGSAVPHGIGRSINPDTGLEMRAEYENGRFIPPGWRELNGG